MTFRILPIGINRENLLSQANSPCVQLHKMEVEKAKRNHFCFSSTFLLVLGIVTFTIAVFEGIGGAILWNHYESELQVIRESLDGLKNTPSVQDISKYMSSELNHI